MYSVEQENLSLKLSNFLSLNEVVDGGGLEHLERQFRVVVEQPNGGRRGTVYRAYDIDDALSRFQRLPLSDQERFQVAQVDELEALTSHLAEIHGLGLTPYRQFLVDGRLASMVLINSEEQESSLASKPILVLRFLADMLRSRVEKHPDDVRAAAVLEGFQNSIEPALSQLPMGGRLVFFSPPNVGGTYECKYGFMYVLEKKLNLQLGIGEISGLAVKLNWPLDEYKNVLNMNWLKRFDNTFILDSNYDDIVKAALYYLPGEFETVGLLLQFLFQNAGVFADLDVSPDDWIEQNCRRYRKLQEEARGQVVPYIEYLLSGRMSRAKEVLASVQMEGIRRGDFLLWMKIQHDLARTGSAQVLLPCGLVELGASFGFGFTDPLQLLFRGVGESSWSYHTGHCVHCKARNVEVGPCNICKKCEEVL